MRSEKKFRCIESAWPQGSDLHSVSIVFIMSNCYWFGPEMLHNVSKPYAVML